MKKIEKVGIIGAGFIGQACARLFLQAGYDVMLSNSRDKNTLYSVASSISCKIGDLQDAIAFSDIIILAIPFINYTSLPADLLSHKIVLDATNYYPDRDGNIEQLDQYQTTTSEMVANHLKQSRIVKIFNATLAKDIMKDAKPNETQGRRAIPIASNDEQAKQIVIALLNQVGFDHVDIGELANGWKFERAKPAYCIPLNVENLSIAIKQAIRTEECAHNAWYK